MKRTSLYIVISVISSLLITAILVENYFSSQPKDGGFNRILKLSAISRKDSLKIGYSFFIAGLTAKNIYIAQSQRRPQLIKATYDLRDTTCFSLKVPNDWKRPSIRVDSPFVYLMDGTVPAILFSSLPSLEMHKLRFKLPYFSKSILISPQSLILKAYDGRQEILTKRTFGSHNDYHRSGILEAQNGDGQFSLMGQLQFEAKTRLLVYVYYYRNQFLALDTGLNVLYKSNTIDTISTTNIKVVEVSSTDSTVTHAPSRPPLQVNRKSCITPEFIFINSALKADNEDKQAFKQSSVIDVYSMTNGEYILSFYLPNFQNQKLSDFMVFKNTLVAIYTDYICTYELDLIDKS